jgi:hypothetical protein
MKDFEVTFDSDLPATPEQAWDALTRHTSAWLWEIRYEPRVGGAERGLSPHGGTMTAWDPGRHLGTRAEAPSGWFNQLDWRLSPAGDGRTHLGYRHATAFDEAEYDLQADACRRHTALYYHTIGEYLAHFAGRDAARVEVDALASCTFEQVVAALGSPGAGDAVSLEPLGADGVVDYAAPGFLGVRTPDSLVRFFGRDAFGWPVGVAHHAFGGPVDGDAWRVWLDGVVEGRRAA